MKEMKQEMYDQLAYGSTETRQACQALDVEMQQEEVGKLIFAEAKEEGTTRLFIKRLCFVSDIMRKDGWWDMFTVTNVPCRKGIWSCRIDKIRLDKNGFPMMEVTPMNHLGESINEESIAWDYFSRSGMFSSHYTESHYKQRFNVGEVEERFYYLWKHLDTDVARKEYAKQYIPSYSIPAIALWKAFCDGKLFLFEVEDALNTPEGFEKKALAIKNNTKEYEEKYPLMMAKIHNLRSDGRMYIDDIHNYLFSRYYSALDLQKDGKLNSDIEGTYELIEASIAYYAEQKKAEKEAKKAAKKAKKVQKACS